MHSTLALILARAAETTARPLAGAGPDIGWMATVVAIVLVCILAVAYGVRRVALGAWRVRAARRTLRVVDVLPLGGRRQMVVVRCYDRTFALGLGEKEVSLVAELDTDFVTAETTKAAGAPAQRQQPVGSLDPAEQFQGLLQRASTGGAATRLTSALEGLVSKARGSAADVLRAATTARAARDVVQAAPAPTKGAGSPPATAARAARLDVVSAEPLRLPRPTPSPMSALPSVAEALSREDEVVV